MSKSLLINSDLEFIRDLKEAGGESLKKCFQCATCSVVCKLSPEEGPFPRKEMIWASWGLKDKLLSDPDVWLCHQCNDCSVHCPRGAKPGDVLAAVRNYAYKFFAFPKFMGKALSNPAYFWVLYLVPMMLMLGIVIGSGGYKNFFRTDFINAGLFLPHHITEPLFIAANIIIFLFAAIGIARFWRGLTAYGNPEKKIGFWPAFIQTILELIPHKKFNKCNTNRHRYLGHMLVFYGFLSAMVATGLAVLMTGALGIVPKTSPLYVGSPVPWRVFPGTIVKIFGNLGGLAIIIGGWLLISQRRKDPERVGASGYTDNLFLYTLFFVALTGLLTHWTRLLYLAPLTYTFYFFHLSLTLTLLWYMPYSKFAHIIYRTLGITYAKMVGRDNGSTK